MKTKRILALLMAMAMTAGVLGGCSSGDTGSSDTSGDSSTPDTSSGSGEVTEISWWGIGGVAPGNFDAALEDINAYTSEKIGVTVKWTINNWDTYQETFQRMVNGGDTFDIMFASNAYYNRFVQQEAFLDITDKVQSVTPELYESVPEALWTGVTINDAIYAVPTYKDSSLTQFWYFDHELVEKYDIDVKSVHTMDDLDPIFRQVKEGEGADFYPVYLTAGNPWNGILNDYDNLGTGLEAIGVAIEDDTRTVVNVLEQEDYLHKLELLHGWFQDGIINQDANVSNETYKGQFFGTGQGWPAAAIGWASANGVAQYDITDPIDGPYYTSSTVQGSLNCIGRTSQHPDEALKFLELVNTDTTLRDMLGYGEQGVDWEYTTDDETGEKRVHQLTTNWSSGAADYAIGNTLIKTMLDTEPATKNDEIMQQNEEAIEGSCMGFMMDVEPVETELAACVAAWSNYKADMQTGARDPKELVPELQAALDEAGLKTVMEEAQRQIDKYFAE